MTTTAAAPIESHRARRRPSVACARHRCALPASQTFEIGAQVGGVLIAKFALRLEALRDDDSSSGDASTRSRTACGGRVPLTIS